jgi:hypothetical protein
MRHSSWSIGVVALAIVGLIAVGGTTVGSDGSLDAVATGILALGAALYVIVEMAARHGVMRRITAPVRNADQAARVAGRRVF